MIHQGNTEWEASFNTDNADPDCPSVGIFVTKDRTAMGHARDGICKTEDLHYRIPFFIPITREL